MLKRYEWFVVRGRITIHGDASSVIAALDPEGSAYCVLTPQDAQEISAIIVDVARSIWQASDRSPEPPARVDGDVYTACGLETASGVLRVSVHEAMPLLAMSFDGGACEMNVTQAVALVQILECMGETLRARADST